MMRRVSWMQRGWAARGEGPGSSIDEAMGVIAHGVETSIPLTLQIAGPAAISAVPTTLIHRHVPSSNGEIENQDIPFVEFTEPDLLWRFSPRTQGTPAPWLTLVVVAERDVTLRASATGLNSVELQPESLPSVDALRLWAHAEVDAEGSGFCRLLSPRRMAPDTSYIALLIPTFSGTRASLLGEPDDRVADSVAWSDGGVHTTLAVYSWTFMATETANPAKEIEKLHPTLNPSIGWRTVDIEGAAIAVCGALASDTPPGPTVVSEQTLSNVRAAIGATDAGEVGPPVRGASQLNGARPLHGWHHTLNLQPASRIAAGLGEELVRAHQEAWVAESLTGVVHDGSARVESARHKLGSRLAAARLARSEHTASTSWAAVFNSNVEMAGLTGPFVAAGTAASATRAAARRMVRPGSAVGRRLNKPTFTATVTAIQNSPISLSATYLQPPPVPVTTATLVSPASIGLSAWSYQALQVSKERTQTRTAERIPGEAGSIQRSLFVQAVAYNADTMIPGIGDLQRNEVSVLSTQPAFIEAFSLAADEEFRRELRWRELPIQQGLLTPHFWPDADDVPKDWPEDRELGDGTDASGTWLAIRSDTWVEQPELRLDAWPMKDGRPDTTGSWLVPSPQIWLAPDVLLVKFNRSRQELLSYAFVFSEPPTGVRFRQRGTDGPYDTQTTTDSTSWATERALQPLQIWMATSRLLA